MLRGAGASNPVVQLTLARFREFWREPGAVFWAFGFPLLLALALGVAFRDQERPRPRVGYHQGGGSWLEETLATIEGRVEPVHGEPEELARALRIGALDLVVEMGGPLASDGLEYRYDPAREAGWSARMELDDALQRALGRGDAVPTIDRTRTIEGGRYVDFLMPGIIGMSLMSSAVWGIGYSIVLARKRKQLKRLAATPMRRWHFMLATFLSRLVFLGLEVVALLIFGALVFDVVTRGSWAALALLSLLGTGAFAGIALVVAARAENVESANGWLNFATLPMWMLSGVFFSWERFPEAVHLPIRLLPLTALNDGLRKVMNEGAGFTQLGFELVVLAVWALVGFALAARRFRWQ
jgi:ABC-2 type transport system permease protein